MSTLASVVSTLATMRSESFAGSGMSMSSSAANVKMEEEEDDSEDSASTNDEAAVANALHLAKENLISKAFDTMAKVFPLFLFAFHFRPALTWHGNLTCN